MTLPLGRKLPAGWVVKRLDLIARVKARLGWKGLTASEYVDDGYVFLSTPNIKGRDIDFTNVNYITEQRYLESPEIMLKLGDVLLSKDGSTLGTCAVVRTLPRPATVNGSIAVIRPRRDVDPVFLFWAMSSPEMQAVMRQFKDGMGVPHLFQSDLRKFAVLLPPFSEQHVIADFLDRETGAIGALIAKKTRFIELLNEKRQTLITHAVTNGLDPHVKMKDSGEKWLEKIPSHWDVVPSNRFFVESKEKAHEADEHLSATQKYGVILLAEYERLEGRQVTHAEKNLEQRKHVEVDNFVISMRSFEGGIERVKARGCVRSSYVALVADERAHVGFFSYLFKSSAYIQGLQATAMFIRDGQDLNYNNFRQVKLPFPGNDEQRRIADFLDREISKSSALKAQTEGAISKLVEYRSALISAAVTGRIDIRSYHLQEADALCQ